MQRYSVVVSDTGRPEPLKLLVPFQSSATSAALVFEVVKRASRFGKTLNTVNYTLHLASADGPLLDPDDILSDLVIDEQLFAVFDSAHTGDPAQVSQYAVCFLAPTNLLSLAQGQHNDECHFSLHNHSSYRQADDQGPKGFARPSLHPSCRSKAQAAP
jgi:hypothetical protein